MMGNSLDVGLIRIWAGINAGKYQDNLPKQEIQYINNLRYPTTSHDVIQKTLLTAQKCAEKYEQQYVAVVIGLLKYEHDKALMIYQEEADR